MNKRFALWGGLVLAMAAVAFFMVHLAEEDTKPSEVNQANAGASGGNENAAILEVREDDWMKGNPDADIIVVKYSDFQCPACRFYASMDDRLSKELADDVLFVYRHFPLRNFQHSRLAARFAEAAGRQGEFWSMHDLIYINQTRWTRSDAGAIFRQFAESLDLDMDQFEEDMGDPALTERIESDYQDGQRLGIRAVPTIFINGEKIQSPNSLDAYRDLILSYQ